MSFKEIIYGRRAINFFDPEKPVRDDLLREMVEMSSQSPSSFNLQPWSLLIMKNQADKERLRKLAWNQPKVSEAPVVLVVLADRSAWEAEHPFVERNFNEMVKAGSMTPDQHQWFLDACQGLYGANAERQQAFACKNAGFFAMSLMLSAKSLGLDTHPMDGFDHDGVRSAFNIPDQYWIPLLLAVGYFRQDQTLQPPKWRKTFDEIVVDFN